MKKNNVILQFVFLGFFIIQTTNLNAQKNTSINTVWQTNVKSQKSFIENKGQFADINDRNVLFANFDNAEDYYFTNKGLIIKLDTVLYKKPWAKKVFGIFSKEKEVEREYFKETSFYLYAEWQNSNPDVQIEASDKTEGYYTFGLNKEICSGYKKITYKNIYPNIDIEYFIPGDSSGIKYNLILHAGADASDISLKYSVDVNEIIQDNNGNIVIKTPLHNITEHAPKSYYSKTAGDISSSYILKDNIITFYVSNTNKNETLIIDPWISGFSMSGDDWGYDVDYDANNNLYVYIHDYTLGVWYVRKYSSTGTLLWTHITSTTIADYEGNFIVDRLTNKIYIGDGYNGTGSIAYRIDLAGVADGFISQQVGTFQEIWDFAFDYNNNQLIALGGGTTSNLNGGLINTNSGVVSIANFTGLPGAGQDISCNTVDNQGNLFVVYANSSFGSNGHLISLVNNSLNGNIWQVDHGMNGFQELLNHCPNGACTYHSNAYNGLAVNNDYLYYYDGSGLAAFNKATGAKIAATSVGYSGQFYTPIAQGGIAVDSCNNIYVGGPLSNILEYNFNGTSFTQLANLSLFWPDSNSVFDIKLDENTNLLYVSGHSNVGVYLAPTQCNNNICHVDSMSVQNQTCGVNNEFTINGNIFMSNPPDSTTLVITDQNSGISQTFQPPFSNNISFTLSNIPYSSQSGSVTASFTGVYTCSSIVNYNAPALVTLSTSSANPSCGASDGAAVVNITANGIPNYSYQWSSGQSTTNTASTTNFINAIPAGVYVVTVTNGNGCTSSTTINLNDNVSFTANISPQNPISCFGQCNGSVIVSLGGSSQNPPFNYNWSNGQSHLGDTLNTDTVNSLCAGLVAVTITDNNGCKVVASILMNEPSAINVNVSSTNPSCSGYSNGSASVSVNGGTSPYTYMWNTSPIQFTQTVSNLTAGSYLVSITDANGCSSSATVSIVDPQPPQASYTYSANALTVNFSNTSSAGTYNWDFGNGYNSSLSYFYIFNSRYL